MLKTCLRAMLGKKNVDADHGQKGDCPHQDGAQEPFSQRFGVPAVDDVAQQVGASGPEERIVKVTHGGPHPAWSCSEA